MARAYRFTVIRLPASSLEDAHEIIGRLTGIGLPRQSMNVAPHDDDTFHVAVHTHAANRERIMRATQGLGGGGTSKAVLAGSILGGAALLGAGLWALWRNSDRVQEFFGQTQDQLRSSLSVGDQDRATMASARGDRKVADRRGRTEETDQPFAPHAGTTIGGGNTTAATSRQSGPGSDGSPGQTGARRPPADTEPADPAVRAGTAGSVSVIS